MPEQFLGILGGSFDPIHYGHLRMAREVMDHLSLSGIKFIPARQQALKTPGSHAEAQHRLAMLQLALRSTPEFSLDIRELERPSPSYTIDTLKSLAEELPDTRLGLILGMDSFADLPRWQHWQELFNYAHIIVVSRGVAELASIPWLATEKKRLAKNMHELSSTKSGKIWLHSMPILDISATYIRNLLTSGQNPQFLLPDAVLQYIYQHQLYQLKET